MTGFKFEEKAKDFDNHINRSIHGYSDFVDDVVQISRFFIESDSNVVDIGSSSGLLLSRLGLSKKESVQYFGIEPVEQFDNLSNATIIKSNFNDVTFVNESCSFVTSMMTIQFLSKSERECIFNKVHGWLGAGGAFVFAEKTDIEDSKVNEILQNLTINSKRDFFSDGELLDKDYQLQVSMRRSTSDDLINRALAAGFRSCERIWMNRRFVGFIAIK